MEGIIYKATNLVNGKCYVGLTIQTLKKRMIAHKTSAKNGSSFYFHNAIRKYGFESFDWEIIDHCYSEDDLKESETLHIFRCNSNNPEYGYNLTSGGDGTLNPSESHRDAIRIANSKRVVSDETRDKMRKSHFGLKHSDETKKKIRLNSSKFSGKKHTVESKIKIGNSRRGKYHSEETKKKYSETRLGNQSTKYAGTYYANKVNNPWNKVWASKIFYNNKPKHLGYFNDFLSGEIVVSLVFEAVYGRPHPMCKASF